MIHRIYWKVFLICTWIFLAVNICSPQNVTSRTEPNGGLEETVPECPTASMVDDIIKIMDDITLCESVSDCTINDQCCETTDGIGVCISLNRSTSDPDDGSIVDPPVQTNTETSASSTTVTSAAATTGTTSSTSSTTVTPSSEANSTTSSTNSITTTPVPDANNPPPGNRSQRSDDERIKPGGTNTIIKQGNELVDRQYILPPDWKSVVFVDRMIKLSKGKINSYLFYFEDTREYLNGMFPGMRLQVWTPVLTKNRAAHINYTLKCEKIIDKDDVTSLINDVGLPVVNAEVNQRGKRGLLVTFDVSDTACMSVTEEDRIGFCSQDLVLPVPYDFGTEGQMDWVFNENSIYPVINDTVQFRTYEGVPIPATFSVRVDMISDEN